MLCGNLWSCSSEPPQRSLRPSALDSAPHVFFRCRVWSWSPAVWCHLQEMWTFRTGGHQERSAGPTSPWRPRLSWTSTTSRPVDTPLSRGQEGSDRLQPLYVLLGHLTWHGTSCHVRFNVAFSCLVSPRCVFSLLPGEESNIKMFCSSQHRVCVEGIIHLPLKCLFPKYNFPFVLFIFLKPKSLSVFSWTLCPHQPAAVEVFGLQPSVICKCRKHINLQHQNGNVLPLMLTMVCTASETWDRSEVLCGKNNYSSLLSIKLCFHKFDMMPRFVWSKIFCDKSAFQFCWLSGRFFYIFPSGYFKKYSVSLFVQRKLTILPDVNTSRDV